MIKYLVNRIDGMPKGSEQTTNVNVVIPILGGTTREVIDVVEGGEDEN
jgi:hypothetical protein